MYYPMLVPPRPWTSPDRGTYLKQHATLVRTASRLHQRALRAADMPLVYEGINVLSKVPWRINGDVYEVVQQAWAEGGGIGDIPPVNDPPVPSYTWRPPASVAEAEATGLVVPGEL